MARAVVGIIGGTGRYQLEGLRNVTEHDLNTPFGKPSSLVIAGELAEAQVFFIARHGPGHSLLPGEVNYRANIFALKTLGATWCLSVSAVGSLREELQPGQMVLPDQFIDRTCGRQSTFFGSGISAYIPFGRPVCPVLFSLLSEAAAEIAREHQTTCQVGGNYVCIEGPALSTRAESLLYKSWGGTVVGMTNLPEAKLAREAELAYATLTFVTDYDCWRGESSDVDVGETLKVLSRSAVLARSVIARLLPMLWDKTPSDLAANALRQAIITPHDQILREKKEELRPLIGRYLSGDLSDATGA